MRKPEIVMSIKFKPVWDRGGRRGEEGEGRKERGGRRGEEGSRQG